MIKNIEIEIDNDSWPNNSPPVQLTTLGETRPTNFLVALLHTALWTRPPVVTGLHLSDYWAWLRYVPAISHAEVDLTLSQDWAHVDPHQKTILSDDFGVGFTTELLADALSVTDFVDTQYFMNVVDPTVYTLKQSKKGPSKTPDYIGRTVAGEYIVLECKGTQNTKYALDKAINAGKDQKKNVAPHSSISQRLVAGLFIPQFGCSEKAVIKISDPYWDQFELFFSKLSNDAIDVAITRVSVAKQLSLMGFNLLPSYLVRAEKVDPSKVKELLFKERKRASVDFGPKGWIADRYVSLQNEERVHLRFSAKVDEETMNIFETADDEIFESLTSILKTKATARTLLDELEEIKPVEIDEQAISISDNRVDRAIEPLIAISKEIAKEHTPPDESAEIKSAEITTGLGFTFAIAAEPV